MLPPGNALAARGLARNVRGYSIYGDYSRPNPPADLIAAVGRGEVDVAIAWGGFIARALPSKWKDAATFVREIARKHPANAKLREVEGALLVAAGDRAAAKKALQAGGDAQSLRILEPEPSLDALFAKPTADEIATVAELWSKRDLSPIGSFLIMGLIGVILASLVNIWLKSDGMSFIISVVGVLVFAGLTAWDTQKIKELSQTVDEETGASRKTAVLGALALYLDFINLFLMLLRLFGRRRE